MRHLLFVVLSMAVFAMPAHAQQFRAEALSDEERQMVITTLRLQDEEIDALDELTDAATAERMQIIKEHSEFINNYWTEQREAMQNGAAPDMELLMSKTVESGEKLERAQSRMLEDLELTLEDERAERMERCRLRLERMTILGEMGEMLSGFGADPITIAHEIGVPERLEEQHAGPFDRAMLAYDRAMSGWFRDLLEFREQAMELAANGAMNDDDPRTLAFQEEILTFIRDLQSAHRERARAVAATLPPEVRAEWVDAWRRRAYPDVFAKHYIERVADLLARDTTLTARAREEVGAVPEDALKRLDRARNALCAAIAEAEASATIEEARNAQGFTSPEVEEAWTSLRDLAPAYRDRLLARIAPERHDVVPPVPVQNVSSLPLMQP